MTEIIFAVLFVSLMGLTRCYKTTVFLHFNYSEWRIFNYQSTKQYIVGSYSFQTVYTIKLENLSSRIDLQTLAGSTLDNSVTLTFDLLTLGSTHAIYGQLQKSVPDVDSSNRFPSPARI